MVHVEISSGAAGGGRSVSPANWFRSVALGAALLVTGCSDEPVSPTAPSAVDPMAAATTTTAMATATATTATSAMATTAMATTAMASSAEDTAVVNLRQVIVPGADYFRVEWDAPTSTRARLRDYQIRVDWEKWRSIPRTADTHRQSGVAGRTYRFEVRARFGTADEGFNGRKSTLYATIPGSAGAPGAPQDLSSKLLRNDDIRLTWRASDTGGAASSWEFKIGDRDTWVPIRGDRPRVRYGPHRAGVTRTYQVRGVNSSGDGASASIEVVREPLSSRVPGLVRNVTWSTGSRNHEYILQWNPPANVDSDNPITGYNIYLDNACASSAFLQPYRPSQSLREYTISVFVGFGEGDEEFGIRAENSAGTGGCVRAWEF